ncbi:porin [Bradyrhizobium sp. F1.13.1]
MPCQGAKTGRWHSIRDSTGRFPGCVADRYQIMIDGQVSHTAYDDARFGGPAALHQPCQRWCTSHCDWDCMLKAFALSICAGFLLRATCHAAELTEDTAFGPAPVAPKVDFQSLRIKGLIVALPGPQDTVDPDFAGIRSSLAALGIGYVGYTNNNFYDNMLPAERNTFGQQVYNGQKPTFFTNNVMQMTYDLSRYGISDGQIAVGGIYNYDSWAPAGPNAFSLATLSYYQTFLNRQVELKVGYLANVVEYWGPFLAGNLSSSIFGPSGQIPVAAGLSAWAWAKPAINIKVNGPEGLYDKFGVQVASSPDGPFAEKTANPTGLDWSTPNSGFLAINEVGYRKEAAPGQLATWVRAAAIINTSKYVDFEFGGRNAGNYAAYLLADRQFVQLVPVEGQAARGWYAGLTAMYAPPEFNRVSEYYEARLYGIGPAAVPARRYGILGCLPQCLHPISGRCRRARRPARAY